MVTQDAYSALGEGSERDKGLKVGTHLESV